MITIICNLCGKTISTYTDPRRRQDDNHIIYVNECYCDECSKKMPTYEKEN